MLDFLSVGAKSCPTLIQSLERDVLPAVAGAIRAPRSAQRKRERAGEFTTDCTPASKAPTLAWVEHVLQVAPIPTDPDGRPAEGPPYGPHVPFENWLADWHLSTCPDARAHVVRTLANWIEDSGKRGAFDSNARSQMTNAFTFVADRSKSRSENMRRGRAALETFLRELQGDDLSGPNKRHLRWLARYQFAGDSAEKIAEKEKPRPSRQAVERAVAATAKTLGIKPRPAKRLTQR